MRFHVMRFRSPHAAPQSGMVAGGDVQAIPAVPPLLPPLASAGWSIGHPTPESQRAGLECLVQIAVEQASAWRCPSAWTARPGRERDGTSGAYPHS